VSINTVDRTTIERYIALMQAGTRGVEDLVNLFDEDAVYIEPFAGQPRTHTGKDAIRAFYEVALAQHLNGVRLTLDRLDIDAGRLRSEWTCHLSGMAEPMRGFDLLDLSEGRIVRLETTVTAFPSH